MGIQLISREKAFELSAIIANSVIGRQQAEYQDLKDDLDTEDLEWFVKRLDSMDYIDPNISYQGQLQIATEKGSLDELSAAFCKLLQILNISELVFIPVFRDPWLRQENDHPPVEKALKYIEGIVSTKEYHEGILVSEADVSGIFISVFWLSRCNASMCEVYFSGVASGIVFSFCKYGDLHLYFYNKEQQELFKNVLSQSGFVEVRICKDIFNETVITGRQIIV